MKSDRKVTAVAWSILVGLLVVLSVSLFAETVRAEEDVTEPKALVLKAQLTLKDFLADPDMGWFRENVNKAKAVLIVPQLIKAGFIFGGTGGSGALLARDAGTGSWSYPAFYTMGSVTFGLQIGGAADQLVLVVMTEKGVDRLLTSSFKLGGDVSVAAGPVGTGVGAKGITADVLAFSRSKGVFGGLVIEGAVIATRDKWNIAYYGKPVRPTDILILRTVENSQADALRAELKEGVK